MAVLRNRRPPRMHPGGTDPLLSRAIVYTYYYFSSHYQITVKIKPLYLTHYTYYMTSSTIRGRTKILGFPACF